MEINKNGGFVAYETGDTNSNTAHCKNLFGFNLTSFSIQTHSPKHRHKYYIGIK